MEFKKFGIWSINLVLGILIMNTVYFQPPDINKDFCEIGMISETDPNYIWYLDGPCKVLIKDVKIIDKENVTYDKKNRVHRVKS